ncbi:DinB family protein [Tenacibaculum haliotis]|uniref:DinB family protein n=1 Tax=Tenacibaculum haliotis TaxID=1888914 RepID=UPI0021B072BF|nr:DinB family protein [Tenacibaculum haliotis]MCT4698800.1 DinB family protein [Tenacibaculum haliotis]
MTKQNVQPNEHDAYYKRYLDKVADSVDLKTGYEEDKKMVIDFFSSVPKDKLEYRYQPEKWTIKELLQHIIDTERIFMYRFLRIARKDTTAMAGFDQDIYIDPSGANDKSMDELLEEFTVSRMYSVNLINSISDDNLINLGTASNSPVSARACAFILLGHSIWHIDIIKERYL